MPLTLEACQLIFEPHFALQTPVLQTVSWNHPFQFTEAVSKSSQRSRELEKRAIATHQKQPTHSRSCGWTGTRDERPWRNWVDVIISEAKGLWEANFRAKSGYSNDEWLARIIDAKYFSMMMHANLESVNREEQHSPWIKWAAEFLNKELGPGQEFSEAWELVRARRAAEHGSATSEFGSLFSSKRKNVVFTVKRTA